jgi:murein DD-endopeptidase MepM/ murein hydrolase activator NlpD
LNTIRVLALVLAATVLVATPARAEDGNDKAKVDAELAQTGATLEAATEKAQQAAALLEAANAQLPAAQNLLADARARVSVAEVAARQADREAAAATGAYKEASKGFDEASAKVADARQKVGDFITKTYQGSGFLAINSILESGSPSEFANRVGYLNEVAAGQQRALAQLTDARMQAKIQENTAQAAKDRADAAQDAAKGALDDTRSAAAVAEQAAGDVKNLVDQRQDAMSTAESERGAVLARYNELKAESDRIAQELRDAANRVANSGGGNFDASPPHDGGAFFLMPTRGWKSSDFGVRYDPFYKVWQLHAGTDIAAPMGQAIFAAADGTVAFTGWSGGYGNYTCISHGRYQGSDLSTCYGHQSQILVHTGQSVRRGEVIGRVGSTGASTGSHLHFEVRRSGDPVNPLSWLPGCLC